MKAKFYGWLAYRLPVKLVYYCFIRAWAHSTGSSYSKTKPSSIRAITVIKRWEKDNAI